MVTKAMCAVAASLVMACNTTVDGGTGLSGAGTDPSGPDTGSEAGSATPEDDSSPESGDERGGDEGAIKLDVASADDSAGGDNGCQKVDFLFVVDNSGSMRNKQINLANSFPGFIQTITETLNAQDYHILVTDTDAWTPISTFANADSACEPYPTCCFEFCGPNSTCSSFSGDTSYGACPTAPPAPSECDGTLGAGRNIDGDIFNPGGCGIADGRLFMLENQPDLLGTFECVAQAGIGGWWCERPVGAAVAALSPELNGPGGCNEGFLRDDALLVLTIISDANPASGHLDTEVDTQEFYEKIVQAKGGDPNALVMLGLFTDGNLAGSPCPTPHGNEHYADFMSHFGDRGISGSVCALDYTPFFIDAVDDIDAACDEFVPPG